MRVGAREEGIGGRGGREMQEGKEEREGGRGRRARRRISVWHCGGEARAEREEGSSGAMQPRPTPSQISPAVAPPSISPPSQLSKRTPPPPSPSPSPPPQTQTSRPLFLLWPAVAGPQPASRSHLMIDTRPRGAGEAACEGEDASEPTLDLFVGWEEGDAECDDVMTSADLLFNILDIRVLIKTEVGETQRPGRGQTRKRGSRGGMTASGERHAR